MTADSGDYQDRPRNVLARNWRRATLDVTVGSRWRLGWRREPFRIFAAGPQEHSWHALIGPVRVSFWPKAAPDNPSRCPPL